MDMQMYRWPGFELQLLGELQRQQNNNLFCDTLLRSEGVSVPTHSCVLAALSPYLYQKLSATPSPPAGQKRQLWLQAVKPHMLLKLVGLLYSGHLVVRGHTEQDDVIAMAHRFGFTKLVAGHVDQRRKEEDKEEERGLISGNSRCPSVQDAQVQAELSDRWRRSCVSTATQTDDGEETVEYQIEPSTPQAADAPQQRGVPVDEWFDPGGLLIICDESAASPHSAGSFQLNSTTKLEESFQSGDGDRAGTEAGGGHGSVAGRGRDEAENSKRDEGAEELMKRVATVKLSETTHISVKVKLRRRTQGEMWEVVGMQTQDEKLSAHRSLQQDRCRQVSSQRAAPHKPSESPCLTPPSINGPERPCQLSSGSRLLPDGSPVSALEDQGSVEESDEQIQKLLEDVMMGLNILDGGSRKPQPADTGFHYGFESPNRQCYTSVSNPPVQSRGGDSTGSHNASSSEQRTSLHPKDQGLFEASSYFSSGQKLGHSTSEQPSRQDILDLLPLSNRRNSKESFSCACMDDLYLLPCLSPIAPSRTSEEKQSDSDHQPNMRRHPLIKEEPDLLQFPLGAITNAQSEYLPQDACSPSCSVTRVENEGAAAAMTLRSKMTANGSSSERCSTEAFDPQPRRRARKRSSRPQQAGCSVLKCKESNGEKSVCLVNLSSNNVLVTKNKRSPRRPEKPEESSRETDTGPADPNAGWTGIRTRGFVRRAQELGNGSLMEKNLSIPPVQRANVVKRREPLPSNRGRGRPRNVKLEVNLPVGFPAVIKVERVDIGPEEQSADGSLRDKPDAETKREKCRKRRRKIIKVEEIPPKRITRSATMDMAVPDDDRRKKPETNGESQKSKDTSVGMVDEGKSVSESEAAWSEKQQGDITSSPQQTSVENRSKSSSLVCSDKSSRRETERRDSPAASEGEMSEMVADSRSRHREDEEATFHSPSKANFIQMTTCSLQDDSEDLEVDVLLCSPDKTPSIKECVQTLLCMDVTPDKEEEEGEEEVDVTGD